MVPSGTGEIVQRERICGEPKQSYNLAMLSLCAAQRHEMEKKHSELRLESMNRPHNLPLVEAQIKREMEVTVFVFSCQHS